MDYSLRSLLVVPVVVGTGYVFLNDGLPDLVQVWNKNVTFRKLENFCPDLDPKIKGQN